MIDGLNLKGTIELQIFDRNKNIVKELKFDNIITNNGLSHIIKTIGGDAKGVNKLYIGEGTTTPSATQTSLVSKYLEANVKTDYTDNNKVRFLVYIPEDSVSSNKLLGEIGLAYKDLLLDILISRAIFSETIYLTKENSMSLSYSITVS